MATLKADQLSTHINSGKIGSIYLFDGPEDFLKTKAVAQILKKLLKEESKDFNLDRFDGVSNSAADVVSSMLSLPFLSERRLVVVQNADEFSAAESKIIAAALAQVPESTCLLMIFTGKANLREEMVAAAVSYGSLVTFWTPFENQLPMWVLQETKSRGKDMAPDAARTLAEACTDLQEMSNEIDKLILFTGKKSKISSEDLISHGLPNQTGTYGEFEDALYARQLGSALAQIELLQESGIRPESLLAAVERVVRQVYQAKKILADPMGKISDVFAELGMRGITQQNRIAQAVKLYSLADCERAYDSLVTADQDIKTGTLSGPLSLTFLVLKLVGREKQLI